MCRLVFGLPQAETAFWCTAEKVAGQAGMETSWQYIPYPAVWLICICSEPIQELSFVSTEGQVESTEVDLDLLLCEV